MHEICFHQKLSVLRCSGSYLRLRRYILENSSFPPVEEEIVRLVLSWFISNNSRIILDSGIPQNGSTSTTSKEDKKKAREYTAYQVGIRGDDDGRTVLPSQCVLEVVIEAIMAEFNVESQSTELSLPDTNGSTSITIIEETPVLLRNMSYFNCLHYVSLYESPPTINSIYSWLISCDGKIVLKGVVPSHWMTTTNNQSTHQATDLLQVLKDALHCDMKNDSTVVCSSSARRRRRRIVSLPIKSKSIIKIYDTVAYTQSMCSKLASWVGTSDYIKYDNRNLHLFGDPIKFSQLKPSLCLPQIATKEDSVIATLDELEALHMSLKEKGIISPRDKWESWMKPFLHQKDADIGFIVLIIIIMSSRTSDLLLEGTITKLLSTGIVSATAVKEVVERYGADFFCSLLRETGRFYQNAERIINAADYFISKYDGRIPHDISINELAQLLGVGYKTANIVVQTAFHRVDGIPSDIHVIRWSKILGWIPTTCKDGYTCSQILERRLPREKWSLINPLFGSLGQLLRYAKKNLIHIVEQSGSKKLKYLFQNAQVIYSS